MALVPCSSCGAFAEQSENYTCALCLGRHVDRTIEPPANLHGEDLAFWALAGLWRLRGGWLFAPLLLIAVVMSFWIASVVGEYLSGFALLHGWWSVLVWSVVWVAGGLGLTYLSTTMVPRLHGLMFDQRPSSNRTTGIKVMERAGRIVVVAGILVFVYAAMAMVFGPPRLSATDPGAAAVEALLQNPSYLVDREQRQARQLRLLPLLAFGIALMAVGGAVLHARETHWP